MGSRRRRDTNAFPPPNSEKRNQPKFCGILSPENCFRKTSSALFRHLPEYLEGRTPKEKHPFLFQKKFHPRQIRNARSVFLSGLLAYSPVRGAFSERTILVRATTRSARAISRDCFQNKFEFCTIDTANSFENERQNSLILRYISKLKSDKMSEP